MNTRLSTITINVQLQRQLIAKLAHGMSPLTINTPQFIVQSLQVSLILGQESLT